MSGSYSMPRDCAGRAGHGNATWRCVRHQAVPDLSGQLAGLCWAEPGQDLSGAGEGALVLEHVVYVAADEHRLVRLRELDAAEPRTAQQRACPAGAGQGEGSIRPRHLAVAEYRRGRGEPEGKERVLIAGAPAKERQPAVAPQRLPQVAERCRRVIEEHDTQGAHHQVEVPGLERVDLGVGYLEPGVSDATRGGEPARFGYLDPGQVGAESVPAAGGACREDGRITAAAPDVENVLPVLDLCSGEQPRPQPAQTPLMPLTLLDEVPPAGPVPVLGLLRIHRHKGNATSPQPCLDRCPMRRPVPSCWRSRRSRGHEPAGTVRPQPVQTDQSRSVIAKPRKERRR